MLNNPIILGGASLPALTNPGTAADLLTGKQLIDASGKVLSGSMTDRGAVSQSLNAGGSYTIPAGYHNGSGRVTANSLSSQTGGTATAADIASGKTAWVNGSRITGTLTETYTHIQKTISVTNSSGKTVVMSYIGLFNNMPYLNFEKIANSSSVTVTVVGFYGNTQYNNSVILFTFDSGPSVQLNLSYSPSSLFQRSGGGLTDAAQLIVQTSASATSGTITVGTY